MLDSFLRPDRFFLVAGLFFGLLLTFLTPPFQVADEPMHFYRSFQVSEGQLDAVLEGDRLGGMLPEQVSAMAASLLADIPFHPENKVAPGAASSWLRVPFDESARSFVDFRNTAQYTFVAYLPQAGALAAGRALGLPLLVSFYGVRLVNLLLATFLTWLAIRQAPGYRWLLAMIALTPMAVFQRASVSIDSLAIAAGFLIATSAAKLIWGEGSAIRRRDFVLLTAAAVFLCLAKTVYVLLGMAVLLVPAARFPGGRRAPFLLIHTLLLGLAFSWAMTTASGIDLPIRLQMPTVDRDAQIRSALAEPVRFLGVVVRDYAFRGARYLAQFVGQLGWLDAKLPFWFLDLYLLVLAGLPLVDTGARLEVTPRQRGFLAVLVLGTMALVSASQYAIWTPYRADLVEGLQGRYYLPIAPLGIWVVYNQWLGEKVRERWLGLSLALFTLVSVAVTARALIGRYYG